MSPGRSRHTLVRLGVALLVVVPLLPGPAAARTQVGVSVVVGPRETVDYVPVDLLLGYQPRVDIVVGIPRDLEAPPDLAQRFDDHLTEELGQDVVVRVGFVEAQVSEGERSVEQFDARRSTGPAFVVEPGRNLAGI